MSSPNLYIIAGCNGAGKTTNSFTVLPKMLQCNEFVNADSIALGLSPFQPETAAIAAGRIMLNRINELIETKVDFAFETTLSTKSFVKTISKARSRGYTIHIIFYWLNNVELAIARVKQRVVEGGHNIPEDVIKRRFHAGIHNLIYLYKDISDTIFVINNSFGEKEIIAEIENHKLNILDKKNWEIILNQAK